MAKRSARPARLAAFALVILASSVEMVNCRGGHGSFCGGPLCSAYRCGRPAQSSHSGQAFPLSAPRPRSQAGAEQGAARLGPALRCAARPAAAAAARRCVWPACMHAEVRPSPHSSHSPAAGHQTAPTASSSTALPDPWTALLPTAASSWGLPPPRPPPCPPPPRADLEPTTRRCRRGPCPPVPTSSAFSLA